MFQKVLSCIVIFFCLLLIGCAQNKATGERQLVLLNAEEEIDIGSKEHPKILKAFGGSYGSKELKAYVSSLGNKLKNVTNQDNLTWTFTILDSPVVNAFALPGGYIYISRGLLTLANDEAELASVLGHEIAHVKARHTAQRHAKAKITNLGLNILDIVLGQPIVSQVASIGAYGVLASFSRSEEIEADILGKNYIIDAGYDETGSYRFLSRLRDLSQLSSDKDKKNINSLFATHPKTKDRMENVKNSINNKNLFVTNRNEYLAMINNITYGESSKNGIVINNKFFHIPLNISFFVPKNFTLENRENSVLARSKNNESILIFDGLINDLDLNLLDLVEGDLGRSRAEFKKNLNIYDRPAILVKDKKTIVFENRQYNRDLILIKWFDSRIWRFSILTDINASVSYYDDLYKEILSFHQLTEEEVLIAQPKKIQIYATNKGESIFSLSEMMSINEKKLEWFKIINGLDGDLKKDYELEPGSLVKIIK